MESDPLGAEISHDALGREASVSLCVFIMRHHYKRTWASDIIDSESENINTAPISNRMIAIYNKIVT